MKTQIDAKKLRERLENAPLVLASQARLAKARSGLQQAQTDYNEAVERLRAKASGQTDAEAVAYRLLDDPAGDDHAPSEIARLQTKVDEWAVAVKYCQKMVESSRSDMAGQLAAEVEPELRKVREALLTTYFQTAGKVREAATLAQALQTAGLHVEMPVFNGSLTNADAYNGGLYAWATVLLERGLIDAKSLPEWRRPNE